MNTIQLSIAISSIIIVITYLLAKKRNNIRDLTISSIIAATFYIILTTLNNKLLSIDPGRIETLKETIVQLGTTVNITLLTYSIISSIINILLNPIIMLSTTISGTIYLIYTSILSKIIPPLELSLSILSNTTQLATLVLTSIADILIIGKYLAEISKIVIPLIFIKRIRIAIIIIVITSIILLLTSIMLAQSIEPNKNISNLNIEKIYEKAINNYEDTVSRNYTLIQVLSDYPIVTILKIRCNSQKLTIIGIGNFRNIVPCSNYSIIMKSLFFDIKKFIYSHHEERFRNITIMYYTVKIGENINILKIDKRYYIGYYVSNCTDIMLRMYGDTIHIYNPTDYRCSVSLYIPSKGSEESAKLSDLYNKLLHKVALFLKLYKNITGNIREELNILYRSVGNIAYYSHINIVLKNHSSYDITIEPDKLVLWPYNLSYVTYNSWVYLRYVSISEVSKKVLSLSLSYFLRDQFSKIIILFIYSIVLDTFGIVALFCTLVNVSSIENVFYKIFIRISKSVLYDFVLVLYFRIISTMIARRFLRRFFTLFRSRRSIIFVDNKNRGKLDKFLYDLKRFYRRRYRGTDYVFRKARETLSRSVDVRVIREIEGSRAPVLDFYRRGITNMIVEDLIYNIYGKRIQDLRNIDLRKDRRLLFLVSSLYRRYDNIIDLSLDVRMVPVRVLVLSLRRDLLNVISSGSDSVSMRIRSLLHGSEKVFEDEFKNYVRDLYNVSLLLSSRIYRKVTPRMLVDIDRILKDVDRSLIFKHVKSVIDYHVDREFVREVLDRYVRALYRYYGGRRYVLRRELLKVRYLRRLFRV
ncbi:MAG: hypothetical protein GXO23_00275 [Crenarchaeota archaeon]|nr:hypothetical protein [Thermoproteota archaeon]